MSVGPAPEPEAGASATARAAGARAFGPSAGWMLLTAGGLVLALTAVLGAPGGTASNASPVRIIVRLPDPLVAALMAMFASVALVILLLLTPGRRRRRKDDEEIELAYESPPVSRWVLLLLSMLLLLPVLLMGYVVWVGGSWFDGSVATRPSLPSLPVPSLPGADAGSRVVSLPLLNAVLGALAVIAGAGALVLVILVLFADRLARWWAGPLSGESQAPLIDAIEESLDDLRGEPDARRAIVKCYRHFERALSRSNTPRAPWQTPREHVRTALRRLPLPGPTVERLTGLFEVSRFSDHPVGAPEREVAIDSLAEIKAALEQRMSGASAV